MLFIFVYYIRLTNGGIKMTIDKKMECKELEPVMGLDKEVKGEERLGYKVAMDFPSFPGDGGGGDPDKYLKVCVGGSAGGDDDKSIYKTNEKFSALWLDIAFGVMGTNRIKYDDKK